MKSGRFHKQLYKEMGTDRGIVGLRVQVELSGKIPIYRTSSLGRMHEKDHKQGTRRLQRLRKGGGHV